jgi:L-aspartate oxidase
VAVIGAGAAGLFAAIAAAEQGARVVLVSRSPLAQSASYWAQGGIAAALADADSPERHVRDTLEAGRRASRPSAVRVLCEEAPARVHDLERMGVHFDADPSGGLTLGLEGGHSERRVVHAGGSATGRRITRELSALAATDERISILEHTTAGALWIHDGRCVGLVGEARDGQRRAVLARGTIVATGGAAALWERTTNPRGAIGAGISLAQRAGAKLADLEFMQFHPTALVSDGPQDGFLITEAIRGEGAKLYAGGERFVDELAPRDEVALAVQAKLRELGPQSVTLDMRGIEAGRFPNVFAALERAGINPLVEPVPVAPAAHYTMGGIATDLDGRSSVPGLLAVGECACTGLHGANRLASNSLADCVVFGHRAALAACREPRPPSQRGNPPEPGPPPLPAPSTRAALWQLAGLERDEAGLRRLLDEPFELARLIATCALAREESRGAHRRTDHLETETKLDGMHVTVRAEAAPEWERWD